MTGRRVEERATMHSISCSRLERERIRALAEREGVSMSKLLVDRALKRNPPTKVRNPPRLVLGPEEQKSLVETVRVIGETVGALEGSDESPGFAETLRVLFEIRLDAMTRTGRHGTMVRLLEQVLQDSRAARIEEEVYERNRS
ncbi:MAG: hypothetical protein OXI95_09250 [bacterium]|nr:hypothetical protein [bacterium]